MTKKQIIICIILAILMLSVISVSLVYIIKVFNNKSENSFTYEAHQNSFVNYEDAFHQEEDVYYLLLTKEDCKTCVAIEVEVCEYINNFQKSSTYKLYLMDVEQYQNQLISFDNAGEPISNLYVDDINELRIYATPTMLKIKDSKVEEAYIGAKAVSQQLREG